MSDLSVAIIFFNRPLHLEKVFNSVKAAKPQKLFLIQDGPRSLEDKNKINECRKIVEKVDWKCEVHRNYSDINLGCGKRPSSGISWAFEHTDSLIVLEDDCVPDHSFFKFCKELLELYKNDYRVGLIAGTNPFGAYDFGGNDYGFVKSGGIWGWATWKDRWEQYDFYAKSIQDSYVKECLKYDISINRKYAINRIKAWEKAFEDANGLENISYWDFQWGLARHVNSFLSIVPRVNLVRNIGCDLDATHENDIRLLPKKIKKMMDNQTYSLTINKHPKYVIADRLYDDQYYKIVEPIFAVKIIYKINKLFKLAWYKFIVRNMR